MSQLARRFTLAVVVVSALALPADAQETVFQYRFTDTTTLPDVIDTSPAMNDATAGPLAMLSTDVPVTGVPPGSGNRSFDSSSLFASGMSPSGAATNANLLLNNTDIAANGGFTLELWFKWEGVGDINAILDYAGTEKIVIDVPSGAAPTVEFRISPSGDVPIGDAVPNQWHYVAVVFDTLGNPVDPNGNISGEVTTYFDGLTPSAPTIAVKDTFGDGLVRPIGIGMHPLAFDLDFFNGLVFEPRVTLGALSPDQLLYESMGTPDPEFRRGDADADGTFVGLIDSLYTLAFQFQSGPAPPCLDAADADDDGMVNGLIDALFSLNFQFGGGSPPPPPGAMNCGVDPTGDGSDCAVYDFCP